MKAIRPRESRLFIDDVRTIVSRNPFVLKVVSRTEGANASMDLKLYRVENFDIEFANNFFYPNDTVTPGGVQPNNPQLLMVPFNLNGDE